MRTLLIQFQIIDNQLLLLTGNAFATATRIPFPFPVAKALAVPGKEKIVVLFDYMGQNEGPFENLICIDKTGKIIWRAPLTLNEPNDAFVDISVQNFELVANTWTGNRFTIDWSSGNPTGRKFTK